MATITVRAGYRILNWSDASGRHRTSLGRVDVITERQAQDILRAKQLELSTGARLLGLVAHRAPSFGAYSTDYLTWHAREYPHSHARIRQIVEQHLLPELEHTALDLITPRSIENWKHTRLQRAEPATVAKELRTLHAILHRAQKEKAIDENPIAGVAAPRDFTSRPHRYYEARELAKLYAACSRQVNAGEGPQPDPVHAAIWRLYANTGMRRMEGLHLRWRDVGKDGLRILSSAEERTKSGDWREIPLGRGAREALERLPRKELHVLPRITPASLSRAFARDALRAELDGSLHTLRHTYISHLVRAGVPLRTVQIYAGHAHYSTTEGYAYLAPGKPPRQVRALEL